MIIFRKSSLSALLIHILKRIWILLILRILTQKEISEKVGKSRSEVANTLRLMKLPPNIRKKMALDINNGGISKGHARAILSLKNILERSEF